MTRVRGGGESSYILYLFLACVISLGASLIGGYFWFNQDPEVGTVCIPEGTADIKATYKYGTGGVCVKTCNTGYMNLDGVCVSEIPNGQFVKVIHTVAQDTTLTGVNDINKIVHLAELEVFAPGGTTNLALNKIGYASTEYTTQRYVNLVDGDLTNYASTKGRTPEEFDHFQVNLGSVQEIGEIKITNRNGEGQAVRDRAIGIKVVILGEDAETVIRETPIINTRADTYTFTFPGTDWV